MKVEANLGVFIEKGYFAFDDLDEPHLKADLADGEGQVGLFGNESYKSIASIL